MFPSRKPFPFKPTIPPFNYLAAPPKPLFTPSPSPWRSARSSTTNSPFSLASPTKERPIFELYRDQPSSYLRTRGPRPELGNPQPQNPNPSPTQPYARYDPAAAATYVDEQLQALHARSKSRRAENLRKMAGTGPQRNARFSQGYKRTTSWLSREDRKHSRLRGESLLGEKRREERRRKFIEEEHKRKKEEARKQALEENRESGTKTNLGNDHEIYTKHWEWIMNLPAVLPEHELLATRHLAMPVTRTSPVTGVSDISKADIEAFLMSTAHSQGKTRRERVRAALLIWHPDKSEKWIGKFRKDRHPLIRELVGVIARYLTEMMTQ